MEIIKRVRVLLQTPLLQNSFFLLLDKVGKLGNFIAILLIARQYGTIVFGEFSYAFAFASILGSFSDLGIKNVLIKFLVRDDEKQNVFLGSSFALIAISSLVCVMSGVLYTLLSNDTFLIKKFIVLLCLSYLFKPFSVIFYFYESRVLVKRIVPFLIFNTTICLFLKIFFIVSHYEIILFGYITLAEAFIEAIILIYVFLKDKHSILNWSLQLNISKIILREAFPLFISGVMIMIYIKIDQILLQKLSNSSETGIYASAVKLLEITYLIPNIITSSFYPKIVNNITNNNTNILLKLYTLYRNISLVLILLVYLFSPILIRLIYGNSFSSEISTLLQIMIPTFLFVSFSSVINSYIQVLGKNKIQMMVSVIMCLFNILLNLILIPFYQAIGAAIATLLTYSLYILVALWFLKKSDNNRIYIYKSLLFINN